MPTRALRRGKGGGVGKECQEVGQHGKETNLSVDVLSHFPPVALL